MLFRSNEYPPLGVEYDDTPMPTRAAFVGIIILVLVAATLVMAMEVAIAAKGFVLGFFIPSG